MFTSWRGGGGWGVGVRVAPMAGGYCYYIKGNCALLHRIGGGKDEQLGGEGVCGGGGGRGKGVWYGPCGMWARVLVGGPSVQAFLCAGEGKKYPHHHHHHHPPPVVIPFLFLF